MATEATKMRKRIQALQRIFLFQPKILSSSAAQARLAPTGDTPPNAARVRGIARAAASLAIVYAVLCPATHAQPAEFRSLKEIRERGVVMQEWERSCAAASLATVLTYGFHDPVGERQVALGMLSGTDPATVKARGGFSMLDMKNFAVRRGYRADAVRGLSLDQLRSLKAPIVIIDSFGVPHFVVFEGLVDATVRLADPAFGNRSMPADEFEQIWIDGIAFVMTRQP